MSNRKNDAGFTAQQRREVQREINSHSIVIDRSVFKKTPEERLEGKRLKKAYEKTLVK